MIAAPDAAPVPDAAITDAATDAGRPTPPPLPIVPNQGGPLLANPELVTITWAGDPLADGLEAFDEWFATSDTWKTLMGEWGVGPGIYAGKTRIATAAPAMIDDTQLPPLLRAGFADGTIPAPDGNRIYMIYPPSGTVVTQGGSAGCTAFQAYHSSTAVLATTSAPATMAYYAVTPRCAETYGMALLDFTTWGASHEAMEAASDPQYENPAWLISTQSLATPELGEISDLCTGQPTQVEGHEITRNWSNVAAKAGARPCVPAPAGPMFGLFADPGEITIAPGETKKLTLHAYSEAAFPAFTVGAFSADPNLTSTVDKTEASDGDTLTLTLTANANFEEILGQNLIFLYAQSPDYLTKGHLIVHAGK